MKNKNLNNDVEYIFAMNKFVEMISKKKDLDANQKQELKYKLNQIVEDIKS